MKKEIARLRWKPRWVSHLGCVKGCLEHLEVDLSWGWLYGGIGHAFIINIHEVICPSGPTAWHTEMLFRLAPNLGYQPVIMFAHKSQPDFASKQEEAWEHVRGCLDRNIPCYGWDLNIPEFYVIYGYDDVGYYYSGAGCDDGAGPKPWQEVGDTGTRILEICSVERCEPAADEKVVKEALASALKHAQNPKDWIFPKYRSGPEGFDLWAEALETGTANRFGQGYNAAVWTECRGEAVAFLKEAKERLAGKADSLFDEAISHYSIVHSKLKELLDLYPFQTPNQATENETLKSPEGAALVKEAGMAERKSLQVLKRLIGAM